MKKITMLILLMVCALGYSQIDAKSMGTSSPVTIKKQQKQSQAVQQTQIEFNYKGSSATDIGIDYSTENRVAYKQRVPLFVAPDVLTAENEAEILAAEQQRVETDLNYNSVVQNRNPLAAIIPNAGATETFAVTAGDFFYDPTDGVNGGPGGDCTTTSSGDPGDYPNCGCVTTTTLTGTDLSVEFLSFNVFGNFDWLNIYDGPDTSSPQIYDSNLNTDTDTLAGMIAANGSAVFNSTSGALTFEFNATAVVNSCGWEVEVLSAGGGGGGGDPTVFGLNLRASCGNDFGTFPLPGPYTIAPISSNANPIYGGDFDDNGTLYAFNGTDATLLTIDTATGAETTVANITGLLASETLRGIAWNESNSTMYLLAGQGEVGSIYTVDLTSGAATLVGSTTVTGWLPIWLAIDSNGNAFMADVGLDSLFSVDLTTGTATLVGALGININFAQDADFDPDTDTLYMGAYLGGGVNVFASVDTTTGVATPLGSVNADCAELGVVAIQGTGGGGGGSVCSQDNPENAFENGYTTSSDQAQRIAFDITVPADTDFTLNTATVDIWMNPGSTLSSSDISFYSDAGGAPGALITTQTAVMPTSQTVIGSNFGFDISEVVFDITPEILAGQAGVETTYWVVFTPTISAGSGYISATTASIEGFEAYFSPDAGVTWLIIAGNDIVYNFEGNCEPIGGGGGCTPDNIETLYAGGNNGSPGGAVYFDITVGASDIEVSTIDMNTAQSGPFTMDVYVFEGTYVGNQGNPAPWGAAVAMGSGTGAGVGLPSTATLDTPIMMSAGTTYAVALVFDATHAHTYTNGDGTNQNYSNGDITLDLGSASNVPFTTPIFDPRVWNGGIGYCVDNGGGSTYDDCSGAIALACGDSVVGETLTATDSGGNAAPDVFYKFTGTGSAQLVTISLCGGGTDYDSVLRVFDDCNLANELAFNDDSCGLQSEVTFVSDGTSTYYIMVEGFGSGSGNFSLDVTCTEPLPNDDCGGAIAVSCGDSVTGTTVGATVDSGAPVCGPAITSPGVWYTLDDTSGLPGDITLSLCNGTDFDSKISVYTGSCAALTCVVGNDDSCGLQSEVTFATDGNTKFYILIHSFGGATGNFTMDVTCMPTPPPNDMIVNSIDVDEIGFPYTDPSVAMPAATTENGNPQGCDLTGANGVWYNFVAGGDGTANAMIVTPGGASSVTFYTAPDENATETDLVLVPQNTNQCVPGTSASIFTLAGQAYYVFVLNTGAVTDIVIDGTNLGVSDNSIAGFSYYPNPTTGVLNLKSVDNIEHVSLYNLLGQRVLDSRVGAAATQLDLSGLSAGSYLMKVTVNGQTGTYKLLKD